MDDKIKFMKSALKRAKKGLEQGEVPVGAVIVYNGKIISSGYNKRTKTQMATSHAEMYAIDKACKKLKSWRLCDCDLYVTLEPCPMCMGAIVNSRIKRVVFGAKDAKAGACGSVFNFNDYPLNHKPEIVSGVMEEEGRRLLSDFFSERRKSK